MIVHGYCPSKCMNTLLIAIVKYTRVLMLIATITHLQQLLVLHPHFRVGYIKCAFSQRNKKYHVINLVLTKHYPLICVLFSLRQTIAYYKLCSPKYILCYLDASKSFNRINHWLLCKKYLVRNIPSIVIRLVCVWNSTQLCSVQQGMSLFEYFLISNVIILLITWIMNPSTCLNQPLIKNNFTFWHLFMS